MTDFNLDEKTQELISAILDEMTHVIEEVRAAMTSGNGLRMASQVHTLHWHVDGLMNGVRESLHGPEEETGLPRGIKVLPVPPELLERLAPEMAATLQNANNAPEAETPPGNGQYL